MTSFHVIVGIRSEFDDPLARDDIGICGGHVEYLIFDVD